MKAEEGPSRQKRTLFGLVATLICAISVGCGVGGDEGGTGARAINWYVFNEPGGAFDKAVADCNKEAGGKYQINYVKLPTDANQQRELIVRRLAAEDDSIDLIGMDVIWTAELAEAGWIQPWEGERRSVAEDGKLEGPLKTVEYNGKIYGLPLNSNTQLLWYRKDQVDAPPEDFTWDEMIDQAADDGKSVEVQSAQFEGLTVWVNALIAGAGGQVVDQEGNVKVDDSAGKAAEIVSKLANSSAAPPGMSTNKEDEARIGFESERSNYQVNYTFIYPSAEAIEGFQDKIGWARYPRTEKDKESKPPLGGINLGVSSYTKNSDLAFDAAECLANDENQILAAELGGLPPTNEDLYEDEKVKKAFPFADVLRESIDAAAPRPVTPAYSDISLAVQKSFHPPDGIKPDEAESTLRGRMEKAAEGAIF